MCKVLGVYATEKSTYFALLEFRLSPLGMHLINFWGGMRGDWENIFKSVISSISHISSCGLALNRGLNEYINENFLGTKVFITMEIMKDITWKLVKAECKKKSFWASLKKEETILPSGKEY